MANGKWHKQIQNGTGDWCSLEGRAGTGDGVGILDRLGGKEGGRRGGALTEVFDEPAEPSDDPDEEPVALGPPPTAKAKSAPALLQTLQPNPLWALAAARPNGPAALLLQDLRKDLRQNLGQVDDSEASPEPERTPEPEAEEEDAPRSWSRASLCADAPWRKPEPVAAVADTTEDFQARLRRLGNSSSSGISATQRFQVRLDLLTIGKVLTAPPADAF